MRKAFVFYINVELNKEKVYHISFKHDYVHNTEDFDATQTYLKTFEKKQVKFCSNSDINFSLMCQNILSHHFLKL